MEVFGKYIIVWLKENWFRRQGRKRKKKRTNKKNNSETRMNFQLYSVLVNK